MCLCVGCFTNSKRVVLNNLASEKEIGEGMIVWCSGSKSIKFIKHDSNAYLNDWYLMMFCERRAYDSHSIFEMHCNVLHRLFVGSLGSEQKYDC